MNLNIKIRSNPSKILPLFLIPLFGLSILVIYAQNVASTDSFHLVDSISLPFKGTFSDTFHIADTISLPFLRILKDMFSLRDTFSIGITSLIYVVTTTITSIITVLGTSSCNGGSCYTNGSVYTSIIIPAILIITTGFGFMYMGVKSFGVFIIVESFVILMLALVSIIPSWFTLLVILFVSAALTKIMIGFFKGGSD